MLTPGPVAIPEQAREVLGRPIMHHRTEAFAEVFARVAEGLKWVFQTQNTVLTLTSSGTGAFEAAMLNFTRRGQKMISIGGGKFGERWGDMGKALGLEVITMPVEWGRCASPEVLATLLEEHPDTAFVSVSHSETSTGVLHPLKELLDVVRASNADALFAVDGITSVGVHPVPMDEWGIDIMVSGSQKAFAVPPGVSFLAANERAWARAKESDHYKYYFDLLREKKKQEGSGQTAFTPAISVILALDVVLQMMREEGLESIWARHEQHSRAMIAAWEAMGGAGFAEVPTHCVSAVRMPEGVDAVKLRALLRDKYGVLVAGAYNEFKPHVLRVGHLGQVHSGEVMAGLAAIEAALLESGAKFKQGAGLSAAQIVYTGAMNTEKK